MHRIILPSFLEACTHERETETATETEADRERQEEKKILILLKSHLFDFNNKDSGARHCGESLLAQRGRESTYLANLPP